MKKYWQVTMFLLCMLCVLVPPVNAQTTPPPLPPLPEHITLNLPTIDYANKNGLISEQRWYWVEDPSLSYNLGVNNIYERYQFTIIYDAGTPRTTPMQFIKVGNRYQPHIEIHYVNLGSFNEIVDLQAIPNYQQYVTMLETQGSIFLNSITKKQILISESSLMTEYIQISKNDNKIEATQVYRLLSLAHVYDYYENGSLKSKTSYNFKSDQENELEYAIFQSSFSLFEKENPHTLLSHKVIVLNDFQEISNNTLRPLFLQNKKILDLLKNEEQQ